MYYWIWKDAIYSDKQASLETRPPSVRDQGLYFDDGVLLAQPGTGTILDIALPAANDGFLTDNLVAPGLPVLLVSSRLRRVLEECGVDSIQYFPVNFRLSDGTIPADKYFIANIIGRVSCVDFPRSDIVVNDGPPLIIDAIDRLVLKDDVIQDLDVFRLGELFVAIVVSSRVKDAIERSGVSGIEFYATDEYIF
jgi:hypothetical protein